MPRAFVTGIAGFAGSHLAAHLLGEGWDVRGADLSGALGGLQKSDERLILDTCDLRNAEQIASLVSRAKPDIVFHLAAVSFVPAAEHAPAAAFEMNVLGTINLLEACRASVAKARVVLVSSAEVYGKVPPEEMPLRESRPPAPASIYALTKRCAEESALYYRRVHGLDIIVLRPFNHIGPRQNPNFVTSSFALQIAEIEAGQRAAALEVGNLEAARDFTDVRDMARAYHLAAERCEPGEIYNICSGKAYSVRDILDRLLALSTAKIEVRQDPGRLRRSDVPLIRGDASRFAAATGWKPECDIDDTLRDILDYWRAQVRERQV